MNLTKCQFLKAKVEYLGVLLFEDGITLSERYVEAVKRFPIPKDVHHLQRFLGLVNYFRRFVYNIVLTAKPLHSLLKKSSTFNFDDHCL